MSDDKTIRGAADQARVAGGENYEVDHFAKKHGITREQAKDLIDRLGNDREKLDEAASRLK